MREICSCGSVGEPVGNHRLYPAKTKGCAEWGVASWNQISTAAGAWLFGPGRRDKGRWRAMRERGCRLTVSAESDLAEMVSAS